MNILNSKKLAFLVLILMSFSCAKEAPLRRQIDESVAKRIDNEITCTEAPEKACAIESEFHELAEHAFINSTSDNQKHFVSLLNIGQDALLARVHLIRSARKSIEFQTYIWENDEVGRLVFMEILKAARRGVKVRIIVDQLASAKDPGLVALLATLHVNLEIAFYNPTFARSKVSPLELYSGALFSFRKINQRMHNKIIVIDSKIGIAGGRNIENKYYDYDPGYSFKDRDIIVAGPAVIKMRESFDRYWNDEVVVKAVYLVDVGQEVIDLVGLFRVVHPFLGLAQAVLLAASEMGRVMSEVAAEAVFPLCVLP